MDEHSGFRVRMARRQDAPALAALRVAWLGEAGRADPRLRQAPDARERSEAQVPLWLEQDGRSVLVAEAGGALVGYAVGRVETLPPFLARRHVGEVVELHVQSDWQGRGVGRSLLETIEGAMLRQGAEVLRVRVPLVSAAARARLEARGYEPLQVVFERASGRA